MCRLEQIVMAEQQQVRTYPDFSVNQCQHGSSKQLTDASLTFFLHVPLIKLKLIIIFTDSLFMYISWICP